MLLSRYRFVSTRERSGTTLFKELTGKEAEYCLDPTMLLTKEMWHHFANHNENLRNEKYILCYIQNYAFSPYPYVDKLIKQIKKLTGYKVKIIMMLQKVMKYNTTSDQKTFSIYMRMLLLL